MGQYSNLTKLSRVKLPSGTTYALVDLDGRALIAGNYATTQSYSIGDYAIYKDDLYKCVTPAADVTLSAIFIKNENKPLIIIRVIKKLIELIIGLFKK